MFSFIKKLFGIKSIDYADLMAQGATIIDVRSPQEFAGGHVPNSINIPLGDIHNQIARLKKEGKPIIACCRSGARSGRATGMLKSAGVEAYNGGAWSSVNTNVKSL